MTCKGRDSAITPFQSTSQFSLSHMDESMTKTPTQFESSKSKFQYTDDDGNRSSILPSAKRPKVHQKESAKKQAKPKKVSKVETKEEDKEDENLN